MGALDTGWESPCRTSGTVRPVCCRGVARGLSDCELLLPDVADPWSERHAVFDWRPDRSEEVGRSDRREADGRAASACNASSTPAVYERGSSNTQARWRNRSRTWATRRAATSDVVSGVLSASMFGTFPRGATTEINADDRDGKMSCRCSSAETCASRDFPLDTFGRWSGICLGTMYFGTTVAPQTSFDILDRYTERGGTFIDTANCYSFWADPGDAPRARPPSASGCSDGAGTTT